MLGSGGYGAGVSMSVVRQSICPPTSPGLDVQAPGTHIWIAVVNDWDAAGQRVATVISDGHAIAASFSIVCSLIDGRWDCRALNIVTIVDSLAAVQQRKVGLGKRAVVRDQGVAQSHSPRRCGAAWQRLLTNLAVLVLVQKVRVAALGELKQR